jgi:hypothetical protein
MDEVIRGVADHTFGFIKWQFDQGNGPATTPSDLQKVFDSVDDYLIDKPGYRVTVTVEREPGLDAMLPRLGLLEGQSGV